MSADRSLVRSPGGQLLGRERERHVIDAVLDGARAGRGDVLVVYGDPGVGKTALLEQAITATEDVRVIRTAGVEAEMELPFAALLQLCAPSLDLAERLTRPQREALDVAFGIRAGPTPDPFLVGLAILGLMAESAEDQPLFCVVDDAHWLDRASALVLTFVARRLLAERIGVVFATRTIDRALARFPRLHVRPLGRRDSRALLESVLPARLDEPVLQRIILETAGNPLALLELPTEMTPAQLAGGFGLPDAVTLSASVQESFTRRLAKLPADARRLLLVAAADPVGDPGLLWQAAQRLGIPESAAETVESSGLLVLAPRVAFRHPLVRSAVYEAAAPHERREVHRALAEATERDADPDRRAWHRAHAAASPDEDVAADLEASAQRAQARGGFAAAAAFLERSSELTLDRRRRASRALAAAEAQQQAGALDAALELVATAEAGPLEESQRAQVDVLRARISFAADRGSDAPPLFLAAARRLEPLDAELAREIYLDALTAAMFAACLGGPGVTRQVARAARAAPRSSHPPRASERLLEGLAAVITDGDAAGTPLLRAALSGFRDDDLGREEGLRWLWLAGRAAAYIWDYENWDALTARQVELSRASGALTVLPLTLSTRAGVELFAGNLVAASDLIGEAALVADATDSRGSPYAPVALAAFRVVRRRQCN